MREKTQVNFRRPARGLCMFQKLFRTSLPLQGQLPEHDPLRTECHGLLAQVIAWFWVFVMCSPSKQDRHLNELRQPMPAGSANPWTSFRGSDCTATPGPKPATSGNPSVILIALVLGILSSDASHPARAPSHDDRPLGKEAQVAHQGRS